MILARMTLDGTGNWDIIVARVMLFIVTVSRCSSR